MANNAFDATKTNLARRQIKRPEWAAHTSGRAGEKVIEHRPITKSRQAVNPSGHVIWMPLYTGPAQSDSANPYRANIEFAKRRFGTGRSKKPAFIWLDECPQGRSELVDSLPEHIQNRAPCSRGAGGGSIAGDPARNVPIDPCQCVIETIKARQALTKTEQAELNRALKTPEERTAEAHAEAIHAAREATDAANRVTSHAQGKQSK